MSAVAIQRDVVLGILVAAVFTFVTLLFIDAPYGRYTRPGWGPTIGARAGWVVMELPSVLGFAIVFALGRHRCSLAPLVLGALWEAHYVHRTFVFPLRLPSTSRRMPIAIAAMGASFNCANAYANARWLSELGAYPVGWLADARLLVGALLFVGGAIVNIAADATLLRLRRRGEYAIPHGGLFDRVASPNYFGELVEWIGFAVATWSLAGAAFAVYTAANLVPRAFAHRRWYREKFPDYPRGRRAIVPYLA